MRESYAHAATKRTGARWAAGTNVVWRNNLLAQLENVDCPHLGVSGNNRHTAKMPQAILKNLNRAAYHNTCQIIGGRTNDRCEGLPTFGCILARRRRSRRARPLRWTRRTLCFTGPPCVRGRNRLWSPRPVLHELEEVGGKPIVVSRDLLLTGQGREPPCWGRAWRGWPLHGD